MSRNDTRTTCLSEQACRDFLSGRIVGDRLDATIAHIENCSCCENRLRTITSLDTQTALTTAQRNAWKTATGRSRDPDSGTPRMARRGEATDSICRRATVEISHAHAVSEVCPDIPGYEIHELIAAGGMGTVFRGHHLPLDRPVAVKVVRQSATATVSARFEREMLAVGKLEHNHIVRAYDAGKVNGVPYIVMELLDGKDLERLVRSFLAHSDSCLILPLKANSFP